MWEQRGKNVTCFASRRSRLIVGPPAKRIPGNTCREKPCSRPEETPQLRVDNTEQEGPTSDLRRSTTLLNFGNHAWELLANRLYMETVSAAGGPLGVPWRSSLAPPHLSPHNCLCFPFSAGFLGAAAKGNRLHQSRVLSHRARGACCQPSWGNASKCPGDPGAGSRSPRKSTDFCASHSGTSALDIAITTWKKLDIPGFLWLQCLSPWASGFC